MRTPCNPRCLRYTLGLPLRKNPFTAPLDELIQQYTQIIQHEPTDEKAKELGGVPCAELQAHLRFVCVAQARILDLSCNLI